MNKEDFNVNVKVSGQYRCTVKRADGTIEQGEWKNTIHANLLTLLATNLETATDFALNNLHDDYAEQINNTEDGIILDTVGGGTPGEGDIQPYAMACTIGAGSPTYSRKVTGVFSGMAKTIYNAWLGWNFDDITGMYGDFTKVFATPTSWSNITLAAADTLTIEWTISFS